MKKMFVLLLACLLVLCSCKPDGEESSESVPQVSETPQVSQEESEVYVPVGIEEVQQKAQQLVERDVTLMGVFAGGKLSDGRSSKNYLEATGHYEHYSVLITEASKTYGNTEVLERMISYPDYGKPNVIEDNGKTKYKYYYSNDFAATAKDPQATVISFDDTHATVSVKLSGKTLTVGMIKTENEWLLTDSVYFAYLEGEKQTQLEAGWENSIYLGTRQNAGSAPALKGKMLVLNVFLNDTFSSWTDKDRHTVESSVEEACQWLVAKSRSYDGVNLAIDTQSLFYVHSDTVPTNYQMAFLDIMFQNTVYVDVNGYIEQNTPDGYDGVCVLFHVWKNGEDYCIPCDTGNTDYLTYYGERAMFYYSKNAGHEASSYVYMILQLCGGETLHDGDNADAIIEMFPDDILLQKKFYSLALQNYTVSPLTAFRLGWSEYLDVQLVPYINN